jgi:hypothetical protein
MKIKKLTALWISCSGGSLILQSVLNLRQDTKKCLLQCSRFCCTSRICLVDDTAHNVDMGSVRQEIRDAFPLPTYLDKGK